MRHRAPSADQSDLIVTLHVNHDHECTAIRLTDEHEPFLADRMKQIPDR
jgi:hypothetical protein